MIKFNKSVRKLSLSSVNALQREEFWKMQRTVFLAFIPNQSYDFYSSSKIRILVFRKLMCKVWRLNITPEIKVYVLRALCASSEVLKGQWFGFAI